MSAAIEPAGLAGAALPSRRGLFQVVARLGWGVADQAVSSLSNFALGLYVAHTFGATRFGAFTLAYVTYAVVLNAARGMASDPLLVRFSGAPAAAWHRAVSASTATALGVGVLAGVVCIGAGLLLPESLGGAFIALGLGLPGLMLQDSWRLAFFAAGRPASALVNDLVWTVLLVGTLAWMSVRDGSSVFGCLIAFGATATIAAVAGAGQARALPRLALALPWLREHRRLSSRYLAENVSASGASQLRSFVLGAVVSLAAVGYVRGTELLMGPFLVVLMGVSQVAVPEASRVFHRFSPRLLRFCLALGGVQAVAALAWGGLIMVVMPLGPGRVLLKDLWEPISVLVPAVTTSVAAACLLTAAMSGLRAMGVSWRSLRSQLVASGLYLTLGALGAAAAGAPGACWGSATGNLVGAAVAWYHLRSALADHHSTEAVSG